MEEEYMLNKILPKTPLGIALTAAAVLLTVSPEARKITRKMAVKGIGAVLGVADGIREVTAGTRKQLSGLVAEARMMGGQSQIEKDVEPALRFDAEIEPEHFFDADQSSPIPFNVMNDSFLSKRIVESKQDHH